MKRKSPSKFKENSADPKSANEIDKLSFFIKNKILSGFISLCIILFLWILINYIINVRDINNFSFELNSISEHYKNSIKQKSAFSIFEMKKY